MPITLRNTIQRGLIGNEWSVPTIYIDPDTEEIVKSDQITAIGINETDDPTVLPENTVVIQVGTKVTEVHNIKVQENIIPEDIFKYAVNVTDFSKAFIYTNIEKIPDGLFDNCTKAKDFAYTFFSDPKIEAIPEGLFDNCPHATYFDGTFHGCKSLKSIPASLFDSCVNISTFMGTFSMCDNLSSIPAGLFSRCSVATNFNNTFLDCRQLSEIPADLFEHCTKVANFYSTFNGCRRLTSVPKGLFDGCPLATSFENTFKNCSFLKSIPEDLFQNNPNAMNFKSTFSYCFLLEETVPIVTTPDGKKYKLWELRKGPRRFNYIIGDDCFNGCTRLKNYNDIPDEWK